MCVCTLAAFPKHELWVAVFAEWKGMFCPAHAQGWTGSKKLLKRASVAGENLHEHSDWKQEL